MADEFDAGAEAGLMMERIVRARLFGRTLRLELDTPQTFFALQFEEGTATITRVAELTNDRDRPLPGGTINTACNWYGFAEGPRFVGSALATIAHLPGSDINQCVALTQPRQCPMPDRDMLRHADAITTAIEVANLG